MGNRYRGWWLEKAMPGMQALLSQKNEAFFEPVTLCRVSAEYVFVRWKGELLAFNRRTTFPDGPWKATTFKLVPYDEELLTKKARDRLLDSARQAIDAFPVGLMTNKEAQAFIEELHTRSTALLQRHYMQRKAQESMAE